MGGKGRPSEATPFAETAPVAEGVLLKSILDSLGDHAVVAQSLDGVVVTWNEGAHRLYGYGAPEVVGKAIPLLEDTDETRGGQVQAAVDEACRSGAWQGVLRRVHKDGRRLITQVTISARRDRAGVPVGLTVISRDLSDLEQSERHLRESQEYNRGLIESNIDALMTTDPLGIITDVNLQMCKMTGVPRDALIGTPFKDYFTDPQRAEDGIRKVLAEDRVTNYELIMRSRSGNQTVVSYNATTFRTADGKLRGVFAAARDITDQKRLEEDLRQAQNYTRGLIEASVDALVTVDPQLNVTDVNEQTVRMTGYSREELIGSPFPEYFTDPERATAGVRQTLVDGFVTNYVLVLRSKTGAETPVSFNASVFKDTDGNVRGIFAAARDIAEQKRLEEDLRQAQNYTRGLIESSVDPMITVDQSLTITDVNQQMVRLTGVPKERLIGSRFDGYFTEPERASLGVRKTLSEGHVTNYELTLRTPAGREVLVSFNASVFKDTAGNVRGIFAVARDVTEQRRLEEQLREQQNYTRGLIEASVDALVTVDPQGRITDVNDQMGRLTGFARQQLVGRPFADFFTDPERATAGVRRTFEAGVVTNYELVIRSKGGAETVVSFNASVFRDTAEKVAGIFAAARDITAQKRLEQELREQQAYNRGLIESNIDALMTTDPLGIITDVNLQMCEVTGRAREELIGSPFKDSFTDPQQAEDGIRRVLAEGRVTNYELTLRSKSGKETVVSYNATTFQGEDGRLRGVFAAARDISAQKRLEQELREQQAYNRGLVESSVDAMLTVDPDLTITDVNEQMVKLSGYSRDQLVGSSFPDYFTEPDRAGAGVRKTLGEGYVTNYELTLRSRHRREILVSFNASVFKDTAGSVRGIFAVARDVTEEKRLEEQLRESQHYNRGLIESSVDALVTVDPNLVVTDVNEQTARLTGYSRDELIGSSFKDYFTEPERATSGVRQTLSEGSVTNYELVLKSRAGKRTVVSFNAGTFRDTGGRVAGILAAARDITAQKRLEQELREQQAYNRSLIESSVDALVTVDPHGVITDVNEQSMKLTGFSRRHLVGSPFVDYFTDPQRAEGGVRKTFDEGFVTNYELILRAKSGRKIPVSFNAGVFRDSSGAVAGILAAARDTTTQKQIEQELQEQQTYTRSLIESNIDALMTTDTIGIITDVNLQMCALTDRTRDELIGTPFKGYFTDPQRAEDGIRRVLAEDRVTNYELTMRSAGGRETVVSYNATTFKDADGRLRGVFAAARVITEQKRMEEQIHQQNRELIETTSFMNNILESSTEYSIIAKDLEGNVLAWNEGARRNYGYAAEEMVGRRNSEILHIEEDIVSGKVRAALRTALETGKFEGEFQRRRKSGQQFTAQVAITLRRDAVGKPIGYVLISKDITEQKLLEEQLRRKNEELEEQNRRVQEANRLKSEFLANMSHELRTPLNAIVGFTELMHDGKAGPVSAPHQEYLGHVLTSSRHLLQLINDVLDLSKVESGKMEFAPEPVDLARLVGEVRDVLKTLTAKKRMHLGIEVAPSLTGVVADPAKLKQVLYNYLSNALKFTPDGGHVTLRLSPEGPRAFRLEVQDDGIGIRPEDIGRLFVEFQQLDASAAKKYPGTGLGLALTKRIVEAQGGQVGVRSAPGRGSVFFAVLPRVGTAAPEATPATRTMSVKRSGAPTILVVEDNPDDQAWLVRTLAGEGYAVHAVGTGAEAVALSRRITFDAVTLDLLLPDMHGWDVLKTIRAGTLNQDVPVIVITVVSGGAGVGFRVSDFLEKPAKADDLLGALGRAHVHPKNGHTVLLVDDDRDLLKVMELHLVRLGYTPVCAADAETGLRAAASDPPAAVVLDLILPGMDGLAFLDAFRRTPAGRGTPVIVWTAKDLTLGELTRLQTTAQAVLHKREGGTAPLLEALQLQLRDKADAAGGARRSAAEMSRPRRTDRIGRDEQGGVARDDGG